MNKHKTEPDSAIERLHADLVAGYKRIIITLVIAIIVMAVIVSAMVSASQS